MEARGYVNDVLEWMDESMNRWRKSWTKGMQRIKEKGGNRSTGPKK